MQGWHPRHTKLWVLVSAGLRILVVRVVTLTEASLRPLVVEHSRNVKLLAMGCHVMVTPTPLPQPLMTTPALQAVMDDVLFTLVGRQLCSVVSGDPTQSILATRLQVGLSLAASNFHLPLQLTCGQISFPMGTRGTCLRQVPWSSHLPPGWQRSLHIRCRRPWNPDLRRQRRQRRINRSRTPRKLCCIMLQSESAGCIWALEYAWAGSWIRDTA